MNRYNLIPQLIPSIGGKWTWVIYLNHVEPKSYLAAGTHATKKLAETELEKEMEIYRRIYATKQKEPA